MTENADNAQASIHKILNVPMPIIIRQASHVDIKNLEWYGQFRHYRRIFHRAYQEQQEDRKYLLVASLNDYPVGRLFIQYKGRRQIIADGRERGYLYSLQVMDFLRGYGIGTQLILSAETILRQRGYQTTTIAVSKTNINALKLYQRLDYQIFDEDDGIWQYYDHRGRLRTVEEPCYFLEKSLSITSQ